MIYYIHLKNKLKKLRILTNLSSYLINKCYEVQISYLYLLASLNQTQSRY